MYTSNVTDVPKAIYLIYKITSETDIIFSSRVLTFFFFLKLLFLSGSILFLKMHHSLRVVQGNSLSGVWHGIVGHSHRLISVVVGLEGPILVQAQVLGLLV